MHVNVAGTVNVFDAVSRRLDRIPGVMYASSSAVYNASDPSPAPETGGTSPSTLYGVSKLADEGIARVYSRRRRRVVDRPAPVRRLRPRPRPGDDVGPDDGDARRGPRRGRAHRLLRRGAVRLRPRRRAGRRDGGPLGGQAEPPSTTRRAPLADVADIVAAIQETVPEAEITWSGDPLPFPAELEAVGFDRDVGPFPRTPLADGRGGDDRAVPAALARSDRRLAAGRRAATDAAASARAARRTAPTRNAAASQRTALNDPVASRTAPR